MADERADPLEPGEHPFTGVFIAIPCGSGSIRHQTVLSLLDTMGMLAANRIYGEVRIAPNDSLVMRARNVLVAWFMASKCSHMLWVDDDIQFDPKDVLRLVKTDKDFVCGAYRRKSDDETYTVAFHPSAADRLVVCAHCGCVELDNANVGFAVVHRRVFERMFEAYPELKCDNPPSPEAEVVENFYALFNTVVEEGKVWGEDYAFSRLWRKIGGRVWLDPSIVLTHYGVKGWTGNIGRWFLKRDREEIEVGDQWKEIQGWLTDQQARLLIDEVAALPVGGTVVELGSWKGRSTALLGMAAAKADRGIRVYAVDHFKGSESESKDGQAHHEAQADQDGVLPEFLENLGKLGVIGRSVIPLVGDFQSAAERFSPSSVDLLFLDGDHAKGRTSEAFRAWEPRLKPGGAVVFHDYNWPGVRSDIEELRVQVSEVNQMAVWRKPEGREAG